MQAIIGGEKKTPMFQISDLTAEELRFQIQAAIGIPRIPKAEGHLCHAGKTAGKWGIVSVGETDAPHGPPSFPRGLAAFLAATICR